MASRRSKARNQRPRKPKARKPPSEYETWEAKLTDRERRVEEVRALMATGQWMAGVSHNHMAKQWGLSPGTVEHIAAEANRLLRFTFRQDDDGRKDAIASILHTFETIRVRGLMSKTPPGLRVALDATEALGRYLGLEPPKKLAIGDADEFQERIDAMSDGELEDFASGRGAGN